MALDMDAILAFKPEPKLPVHKTRPSQTVREFVNDSCDAITASALRLRIERAISFDERLHLIWNIPITFNYALKKSAGRANYRYIRLTGTAILDSIHIELHPGIAEANEHEIISTLLHEIAHCCAFIIYGHAGSGHGREWFEAMVRLGEQPWNNRYHNIATCTDTVANQRRRRK